MALYSSYHTHGNFKNEKNIHPTNSYEVGLAWIVTMWFCWIKSSSWLWFHFLKRRDLVKFLDCCCRYLRREKELTEAKHGIIEAEVNRLRQQVALLKRHLDSAEQSLAQELEKNAVRSYLLFATFFYELLLPILDLIWVCCRTYKFRKSDCLYWNWQVFLILADNGSLVLCVLWVVMWKKWCGCKQNALVNWESKMTD